jgi:hypothetical protein
MIRREHKCSGCAQTTRKGKCIIARGTSIGILPDPLQACTIRGIPLPDLSVELSSGPDRPKKHEKGKREKRKKDAKTEPDFL